MHAAFSHLSLNLKWSSQVYQLPRHAISKKDHPNSYALFWKQCHTTITSVIQTWTGKFMHVKFNLGVLFMSRGQWKKIDLTNRNSYNLFFFFSRSLLLRLWGQLHTALHALIFRKRFSRHKLCFCCFDLRKPGKFDWFQQKKERSSYSKLNLRQKNCSGHATP